jgi:hypothetical protein
MFFTAVYGCSMWSDNISAKHKLEVTGLKGGGETKEGQQWDLQTMINKIKQFPRKQVTEQYNTIIFITINNWNAMYSLFKWKASLKHKRESTATECAIQWNYTVIF